MANGRLEGERISRRAMWAARVMLLGYVAAVLFAAVVLAMILGGCSSPGSPQQAGGQGPSSSQTTSSTEPEEDLGDQGIEAGVLGTPYRYSNGVEMTLKVEEAKLGEFDDPKRGYKYIAVIMMIRNGSNRTVDPSLTAPHVYYGEQNITADQTFMGDYESIDIHALRQGRDVTGGYVFEVPVKTTVLAIEAGPGSEIETGERYESIIFDARI